MAFDAHVGRDRRGDPARGGPGFLLAATGAVISALFVCLLIAGAFLGAFVRTDLSYTIGAMFVFAMMALIACLLLFLREIFVAVSTPRHVPR